MNFPEGKVTKSFELAQAVIESDCLISLCKMPSMVCLSTMKPAMLILCAVILLAALAGILQARKQAK